MKHNNGAVIALLFIIIVVVWIIAQAVITQNNIKDQTESKLLEKTTTFTSQKDICYLNDANIYHYLDVYLPDDEGPFPVIIYIHGGGWVEGSKEDFEEIAILYAQRGIAGFSIDYSLTTSNNTSWPQNIQDVVLAIDFIKENAATYRIDTTRIALLGASSGGHLASLVGTLSGNEDFLSGLNAQHITGSKISAVINYGAVTDLEYIGENCTLLKIYEIISGAFGNITYQQNSNLWKQASPITYISGENTVFFSIHGRNDTIVPIEVAEAFDTKLQNAGIETYFIKINGDHDIITSEELNTQARLSLDPFLRNIFNLSN